MKVLPKEKLTQLLSKLSQSAVVYVPKDVAGQIKFAPFVSNDPIRLDTTNSLMPPKDLLFPQCQNMYHYGVDSHNEVFIDPIIESSDQVIFGIRPCDMRSIECLDDVFLTKGFVDEYYQAKRDKLLTVALGCTNPAQTCFCESMGLDPNAAPAADIFLREDEQSYAVYPQTEKGNTALEAWEEFLEEGEVAATEAHCTLQVDAAHVKEQLDFLSESDELWNAMSIKCLNCGTCTFLCPTCYCFDISQENKYKEGVRFRCWDSCMFSEYTEMAGGHNPRPTKRDRVRNRFMHKLNYFEDRYGKKLCVGCGRCVEKCPVNLDITVLIDKIGALSHE